jgi:predicted ester cyclase
MSEANKALMRRELEEVWNKHNPDAVDEFYAPDLVNHSAPPGMPNDREGFKAFVGINLGAFPDVKVTNDIPVAEGDRVVGIPATGKRVEMTGITIVSVADGKIAELWMESDQMGLMQQLGVVPPPGG